MNIYINKQKTNYYIATCEEETSNLTFTIESDNYKKLKRCIAEIGYKTTYTNCRQSYLSENEIEYLRLFANEYINETTKEIEVGIFLFVSEDKDCIFIGYYKDVDITDSNAILDKFVEWLNTNTKSLITVKEN